METILIVATILGGLSALWFFWDKVAAGARGGVSVNQHDVKLYDAYRGLLIENGVAEFYQQHDFLGSFPQACWSPLSQYVDTWATVEHEFADKQLEKAHEKVYAAALKLGTVIATNTVPIGDGTFRSVKPDHLPPGPLPEHIRNEAKEINDSVPAFVGAHQAFVRLAIRRLRK